MSKTSFITGAFLGLAAGLLLAPQKGEDLREDLTDKAKKMKKKLDRLTGKAATEIDDLRDLLEDEIDGLSNDMRYLNLFGQPHRPLIASAKIKRTMQHMLYWCVLFNDPITSPAPSRLSFVLHTTA